MATHSNNPADYDAEANVLSPEAFDRLRKAAADQGLPLDRALEQALDFQEIILDAKRQINSDVFVERDGKRYRISIHR